MKKYKKIKNWSETLSVKTKVYEPKNYLEMLSIFKRKQSLPMGGCNSYGDCIFDENKKLISTKFFDKIVNFDPQKKIIDVQSGASLKNVLNFLIPKNFIINSLPGTYNATIGGCISANVHGKDTFKNGTFSNNIIFLKVLNLNNKIVIVKKKEQLSHYIGTHGINGIILEARLRVVKILGPKLITETKKFYDIDSMQKCFDIYIGKKFNYMGAWIDHFNLEGRGIFKASKWIQSSKEYHKLIFKKKLGLIRSLIYFIMRNLLISRFFIMYFNKFLFNLISERKKIEEFPNFYYPQENLLTHEKKLFKGGKINIQILIKIKKFNKFYSSLSLLCKEYKCESWWLGLKRHKKEQFNHFFSDDGYDLTLQWSKEFIYKQKNFLKKLATLIKKNNAKIYLAQDTFFANKMLDKKYLNDINNSINIRKKIKSRLYKRILAKTN